MRVGTIIVAIYVWFLLMGTAVAQSVPDAVHPKIVMMLSEKFGNPRSGTYSIGVVIPPNWTPAQGTELKERYQTYWKRQGCDSAKIETVTPQSESHHDVVVLYGEVSPRVASRLLKTNTVTFSDSIYARDIADFGVFLQSETRLLIVMNMKRLESRSAQFSAPLNRNR
jgi:hypothetical protein